MHTATAVRYLAHLVSAFSSEFLISCQDTCCPTMRRRQTALI
jgi:hypothetical protein